MTRLVLDHNLMFQLWNDPLFWESAPDWEADRELADTEVAAAVEDKSSRGIRHSELYQAWVTLLTASLEDNPEKVRQITDYIHKKRKHRREQIVLPATVPGGAQVLLSNGVETDDTSNSADKICRDES
jgi:hypothetical protein